MSNRQYCEQRENKPLPGCQTRNTTEARGVRIFDRLTVSSAAAICCDQSSQASAPFSYGTASGASTRRNLPPLSSLRTAGTQNCENNPMQSRNGAPHHPKALN